MNKPIDKTTLGYLGPDFQYKLVKHFMEEPGFFPGIYSVVEPNTFTELLLRQFVGVLKDYYSTTSIVPSYETMTMMLKQRARMENELEEWDALIKELREMSPEGSAVVEETATKFFKQQNMIKVANSILKKTQDGDFDHYDECMQMMEDALKVGNEDDMGFNPYDLVDEVLHPNSDIPIPTGISYIDDKLGGGLYKGHLGLVLGPTGFGKTTYSTAIASFASTYQCDLNQQRGWKVLQICFEDDVKAMSKKHFSRITQIEAKDITRPYNIQEARELLEEYDGKELFKENLLVKKYKTQTKSVDDIKIFLKRLINKGFKPDMVVLDYFECLKLIRRDKNETKWDLQESTMRQLEVMAEEFDIALWIMTQGNRGSVVADVVTLDQAGGSITKVQIGHVILSIARAITDFEQNIATIAILKNRQGSSGNVFRDIKFNNGTCTISCDEVEVFNDSYSYEQAMAQQDEITRNNAYKIVLDSLRKKEAKESSELRKEETTQPQAVVPEPEVKTTPESVELEVKPQEIKEEPIVPEKPVIRRPVEQGKLKLSISKPQPLPTPREEIDIIDEELGIQMDEWESGVLN